MANFDSWIKCLCSYPSLFKKSLQLSFQNLEQYVYMYMCTTTMSTDSNFSESHVHNVDYTSLTWLKIIQCFKGTTVVRTISCRGWGRGWSWWSGWWCWRETVGRPGFLFITIIIIANPDRPSLSAWTTRSFRNPNIKLNLTSWNGCISKVNWKPLTKVLNLL